MKSSARVDGNLKMARLALIGTKCGGASVPQTRLCSEGPDPSRHFLTQRRFGKPLSLPSSFLFFEELDVDTLPPIIVVDVP